MVTPHRRCLDALTESMALPRPPSRVRLLRGPVEVLDDDCEYEVVRVVEWECRDEDFLEEPQGPPHHQASAPGARVAYQRPKPQRAVPRRRQQGRIQDYGRRAR